MNKKSIYYPLLLTLLLISVLANAQGLTVSPTRLFFYGNPGEVMVQNVSITNSSNAPYSFKISLSDWYRDSIGQKVYFAPGTLRNSNAAWIKTSEANINILPKETKTIEVKMSVPANADNKAFTNSMLMVTQIARQQDKYSKDNNVGIKVLFEFALHIYNTPKLNTTEDLDFVNITQQKQVVNGQNITRVAVKVKNTGNTSSDSSVDFELTNKETGEETKLSPAAITMMPGAEQILYFDIPKNLKGKFLGVAILRIGSTSNVKVGEKNLDL